MEETILTEQQSACRAAHEQVQLLQHLYGRLASDEEARSSFPYDVDQRVRELQEDRQLLVGKLKTLGLLRSEPDPEWEGLLELATKLGRALTDAPDDALTGGLASQEQEYLRLGEQLAAHDDDVRLVASLAHTRDVVGRLTA